MVIYLETMFDLFRFILKLHGDSSCTQTSTQFIIDNTRSLMSSVTEPLCTKIKDMQDSGEVHLEQLLSMIEDSTQALHQFSTQHRRYKFMKEKGWLKPESVLVGHRVDTVVSAERSGQKSVPVTYQYIPLVETVKKIMSNPKIVRLISKQSEHKSPGIQLNFTDGRRYVEPKDPSKLHIILSLYCDDIEVINALGANSGVHKLSMYYFSILNLPPELLTSTSHIHLIAVASAQDVKVVGHNAILSRFVQDLKQLQEGVQCHDHIVTANLGVVCADNLAANSLICMNECFVAEHFCRFCFMNKEATRSCCQPPAPAHLRTEEVW